MLKSFTYKLFKLDWIRPKGFQFNIYISYKDIYLNYKGYKLIAKKNRSINRCFINIDYFSIIFLTNAFY